jgi:hypothetical protein
MFKTSLRSRKLVFILTITHMYLLCTVSHISTGPSQRHQSKGQGRSYDTFAEILGQYAFRSKSRFKFEVRSA